MMMSKVCRCWVALLAATWATLCDGVVPAGQLSIRYSYTTIDFSLASFGGSFTQVGYSPIYRLLPPTSGSEGCGDITLPPIAHSTSKPVIVILERGTCSFYDKAKNAQAAGAAAVLIYNSVDGIYGSNSYASTMDYNCENDQAWISSTNETTSCGSDKHCNSGVCLNTNTTNSAGARQICCAWDLYLSMGGIEETSGLSEVHIPVGFLRMQDHDTLSSDASFGMDVMEVLVYQKADWWNWSGFTLWALAIFTVIYGAIHAAEEDKIYIHTGGRKQANRNDAINTEDRDDDSISSSASLRRVRRSRNKKPKGHTGTDTERRPITESTGLLAAASKDGEDDDGGDDGYYQHQHKGAHNSNGSSSSSSGGGQATKSVWWAFGLFGDGSADGSGLIDDIHSTHTNSIDNDDGTLSSLRSGASEFFLRVNGHVVHASDHVMDGVDEGPGLALGPAHALVFIVTASSFLLIMYYVDIFTYYTLLYLTAAAVCLHSKVLLPSVEWMKESVYKWVYLYDCSELGGDCSKWWDDCCMDAGCTDGVPYRLPEMTVDDEDAIYDEETGAVVTESALNHSSRYYVRPPRPDRLMDRRGDDGDGVRVDSGSTDTGAQSRHRNERNQLSRGGMQARSSTTIYGTEGRVQQQLQMEESSLSVYSNSENLGRVGEGNSVQSSAGANYYYGVQGSLGSRMGETLATCCYRVGASQFTQVLLTLLSLFLAAGMAAQWYLYPTAPLRWLIQDALAVSVCVTLLGMVQVPNLKVASLLLGCAFFYDIFFTLLTPMLFGSSIMVAVASGSASEDSSDTIEDENYCEKYPEDDACVASELPMMLYMPAFLTWDTDNDAMLGLGDIVLPGLLLVWAARYDLRRYGSLYTERAGNGYFPMIAAGYAIGLCLAMVVMEATGMGQPALMYIVPCTLVPVLMRSMNSGTLPELWEGLPPMKSIGLLLDEQEQEKLRTGQTNDIINATAVWPWDRGRHGSSGSAPDDQSVHSLHGYNLDSAQRVGLPYPE